MSSSVARAEAKVAAARTEVREWAARDWRLTTDEERAKVRATEYLAECERSLERARKGEA